MKRIFSLVVCASVLFGFQGFALCDGADVKFPRPSVDVPPETAPKPSPEEAAKMLALMELRGQYLLAKVNTGLYGVSEGQKGSVSGLSEFYLTKTDQLSEILLTDVLGDYFRLKSGARSAAQVSQAADELSSMLIPFQVAQSQKIIQQNESLLKQNERMIALLEEIAKKK